MNPYPIDNLWKKGHYLQAITGPDPKWPVGRELVTGKPIKTRGVIEYGPGHLDAPSWILRAYDVPL
jgi:hypothetical protein